MKALKYICQISFFKTLVCNFKLLPLKIALKFPILVGRKVKLELKGKVSIESSKIRTGMISIGIGGSRDLGFFNSKNSYFGIKKAAL